MSNAERRTFLAALSSMVGAIVARRVWSDEPSSGAGTSLSSGDESGAVPAYLQRMLDYEVRHLTGPYSSVAGNDTMLDVTPPAWRREKLHNVINAFSGGVGDPKNRLLYVFGGGHGDSSNNGLYVYDFKGSSPAGWSLPSISELDDVVACSDLYRDGRPQSRHTYDGCVFDGPGQAFYSFGGARACPTAGPACMCKWDVRAQKWMAPLPEKPRGSVRYSCAHQRKRKALFYSAGQYDKLFLFDFVSGGVTAMAAKGLNSSSDKLTMCLDERRERAIVIGYDAPARLFRTLLVTVDFDRERVVSVDTFDASGDHTELFSSEGQALAVVYDEDFGANGTYWMFGGKSRVGLQSIFSMDAETFAVHRHPLTGDSIAPNSRSVGTYKRAVFLKSWRRIGVVTHHDQAPFVIKLPDV